MVLMLVRFVKCTFIEAMEMDVQEARVWLDAALKLEEKLER